MYILNYENNQKLNTMKKKKQPSDIGKAWEGSPHPGLLWNEEEQQLWAFAVGREMARLQIQHGVVGEHGQGEVGGAEGALKGNHQEEMSGGWSCAALTYVGFLLKTGQVMASWGLEEDGCPVRQIPRVG